MECICQIIECVAYMKSVLVRCGYGTIDVMKAVLDCPMCRTSCQKFTNMVFVRCIFEIEGQIVKDGPVIHKQQRTRHMRSGTTMKISLNRQNHTSLAGSLIASPTSYNDKK
jgi:hypothetical protein